MSQEQISNQSAQTATYSTRMEPDLPLAHFEFSPDMSMEPRFGGFEAVKASDHVAASTVIVRSFCVDFYISSKSMSSLECDVSLVVNACRANDATQSISATQRDSTGVLYNNIRIELCTSI